MSQWIKLKTAGAVYNIYNSFYIFFMYCFALIWTISVCNKKYLFILLYYIILYSKNQHIYLIRKI